MFSRLQNEVSGSKKFFVLITDAEDSQGSSSCAAEIKKVFGNTNLVDINQIGEIMKKISGALEVVSKCDKGDILTSHPSILSLNKKWGDCFFPKLKEEIKSLEQEIDKIADLSDKNAINECLEDVKDELAGFEARQKEALLNSAQILLSIKSQKYDQSKSEKKIKTQENNVDQTANSAKKGSD
ncbi:hypothetical protein RFI_20481 [Reticulomyxa filosa]|uniref:Uncharacterized protein n=1 Tax=Reticulomyxa filosa TaxID=46433 RepID=X6MTT5_RETFI|nr:hypothetical protein RFI_20481 [Reticulomyxa filosa]|eukprot:ETO16857.1 hypothetical protein RFI_20481 [Reticulomyxa filosa]